MHPTITSAFIEENVDPTKRLGRHFTWDSESARYLVAKVPAATQLWKRVIPILNQGNVGSCTGNAACGALGTEPLYSSLQPSIQKVLTEVEAVKLYAEATHLDSYPGVYPGDDTGSDGLSVAKAATNDGLISGYVHAITLDQVQSAMQSGPVILGLNWYSSFDNPGMDGGVSISPNSVIRGGHEVEVTGMDVVTRMFRCANSWGTDYGDKGYFQFSFDVMGRLLAEQGEAVSFIPITAPAPVPTPTPVPQNATDVIFADALHSWLQKGPWYYRSLQTSAKAWLSARNL